MKIVTLIARLLLGLIFVVFGLNGFLNFLSMGPMPTGLAGQFIGALFMSHYFKRSLWSIGFRATRRLYLSDKFLQQRRRIVLLPD